MPAGFGVWAVRAAFFAARSWGFLAEVSCLADFSSVVVFFSAVVFPPDDGCRAASPGVPAPASAALLPSRPAPPGADVFFPAPFAGEFMDSRSAVGFRVSR